MSKEKKKPGRKRALVVLCILAAIFVPFCHFQNNHLTVSEYEFADGRIDAAFDGFRIVQLSDLHNKGFGKDQQKLMEKVKELEPDIIVITGDIVDDSSGNMRHAVSLAREAVKVAPVYYITGNHECWLEEDKRKELFAQIEAAGVTILNNGKIKLRRGGASIVLAGLDDESLNREALSGLELSGEDYNVLLAHEPQKIRDYAAFPVDLVLAGHAHGGQFRLPLIGPVVAPDQGFFPEYTAGTYSEKDTVMVVSRGLGNSIIPLRLFDYPDIVSVTLHTK